MSERHVRILRTHDDREIPVAGEYAIDPAHTSVEFVGRHLMITKVRGRFTEVSGTITVAEEPERSHVEVELKVSSLDTGHADRDIHLRSEDFFGAGRYPNITFRSTKVKPESSGAWAVTGDLTIRGVARPITLQVYFDGASGVPTGDDRIAFSAAAEVDREDWGLKWNVVLESGGILVGKKARIELNIQSVAAATTTGDSGSV